MKQIETDRLLIRNFLPDDWKALQQIVLDFQASPYAAYDYPWPTSDNEIQGVCAWFSTGDSFLAVCPKGLSEPIGYIALNPEEQQGVYNLGYCFHSDAHGKGYASEACRAILCHAFTERDAVKLTSGTAAGNAPSCRLLERLGFHITGEHTASFCTTPQGEQIVFKGYSFELGKEEFLA